MSKYGPFVETSPGGFTGWIEPFHRTPWEHFRRVLGRLDGDGRYTYVVWRGTDPSRIAVDTDDPADTFLQAAGSAEAMTVEVRLNRRLYTVGRRESSAGEKVLIPISDTRAVSVSPNEVFTADEAATIFEEYTQTDGVEPRYELRERDLAMPQSVPR